MRTVVAVAMVAALGCTAGERRGAPSGSQSGSPSPTRPPVPATMAAMGDSITRAFLDCPGIGDCPDASWSTGTDDDIDSHRARLSRLAGRAVTEHNVAVSGARVAGLDAQARRAVETGAGYVTILIGANDACRGSEAAMTPVAEYAAAFEKAMATLDAGLPDARVLVASIPDLQRLWEVGRDRPEVRATWERFGICQSVLAPDAPRARVRERVAAYNRAMADSCARRPGCRWDGGAVFGYEFTLEMVSPRDYWHPSRAGQRTLSEVTWNAGWWA